MYGTGLNLTLWVIKSWRRGGEDRAIVVFLVGLIVAALALATLWAVSPVATVVSVATVIAGIGALVWRGDAVTKRQQEEYAVMEARALALLDGSGAPAGMTVGQAIAAGHITQAAIDQIIDVVVEPEVGMEGFSIPLADPAASSEPSAEPSAEPADAPGTPNPSVSRRRGSVPPR